KDTYRPERLRPILKKKALSLVVTLAAHMHDLEGIKGLKNHGAHIDQPDKDDSITALHIAALTGNKEIVQWLLQNGADVTRVAPDGRTALSDASTHEISDMLQQALHQKEESDKK